MARTFQGMDFGDLFGALIRSGQEITLAFDQTDIDYVAALAERVVRLAGSSTIRVGRGDITMSLKPSDIWDVLVVFPPGSDD